MFSGKRAITLFKKPDSALARGAMQARPHAATNNALPTSIVVFGALSQAK